MADGFFARLSNLWGGFWSLWLGDREKENPEAVYEAAINARVKQYQDLKKGVMNIVYLRNKLSADLEKKQAELADVQLQIPVAVDQGEDEVALVLLEQKDALTKEIESIEGELNKVKGEAEQAKSTLVAFQADIEKLKKEKETMLARKETAEARIRIQDRLSGLTPDADIKALENVREHIGKLSAEADVQTEMEGTSLESKLASIRQKTASSSAQAQLAALKAARLQREASTEQSAGERTAEGQVQKTI